MPKQKFRKNSKRKPNQKFNPLNFSYFFSVSFLSLLSIFIFLIFPFFSSPSAPAPLKRQPQQLPVERKEPEILLQTSENEFPDDFFQEIKFGETKKGVIDKNDKLNPYSVSGFVDGYKFTLPDLDNYDDVEIYFRSCPDDGDSDQYNNCRSESSFNEQIEIFNSKLEKLDYSGETRIDFDHCPITDDKTYYILVGSQDSANTPSRTGEYKITFSYEKTPAKVKLKFKGIDENKGDLKVHLKLYLVWTAKNQLLDLGEIIFKGDKDGFYTGKFDLSNKDYDFQNYTLLVKGPKHLQSRFDNLSFVKNQVLDFTSQPLEPGDLPLPQDGKVDNNDFNYLWDHRGSTNPDDLKTGDLNLDGAINMGDINLLLETLSVKYDEEGW